MNPELKAYLDEWQARQQHIFDDHMARMDALLRSSTRLGPAEPGSITGPVTASSDTAELVSVSARAAARPALGPSIMASPVAAPAAPMDTIAVVPASCSTECATQAVNASTTTTLLPWVSRSSSSPATSVTNDVVSTELAPDNDDGEYGNLLDDSSVKTIPFSLAAAISFTADACDDSTPSPMTPIRCSTYGSTAGAMALSQPDKVCVLEALVVTSASSIIAKVVTTPSPTPATSMPPPLWSSPSARIRCHGLLLRPMPGPSFLVGQLTVTGNRPRPWPSFTSSCPSGSQNQSRLPPQVTYPSLVQGKARPSKKPTCVATMNLGAQDCLLGTADMKPIQTSFTVMSSCMLHLLVFSGNGQWWSHYCWLFYCLFESYTYWGVHIHELGAETPVLQESIGHSYCYMHFGAVQNPTLVCCAGAILWLLSCGHHCAGYFGMTWDPGYGNLCTSTSCITIYDMCSASELRCWYDVLLFLEYGWSGSACVPSAHTVHTTLVWPSCSVFGFPLQAVVVSCEHLVVDITDCAGSSLSVGSSVVGYPEFPVQSQFHFFIASGSVIWLDTMNGHLLNFPYSALATICLVCSQEPSHCLNNYQLKMLVTATGQRMILARFQKGQKNSHMLLLPGVWEQEELCLGFQFQQSGILPDWYLCNQSIMVKVRPDYSLKYKMLADTWRSRLLCVRSVYAAVHALLLPDGKRSPNWQSALPAIGRDALLFIIQSSVLNYMDYCWLTTAILTEIVSIFSATLPVQMEVTCSVQTKFSMHSPCLLIGVLNTGYESMLAPTKIRFAGNHWTCFSNSETPRCDLLVATSELTRFCVAFAGGQGSFQGGRHMPVSFYRRKELRLLRDPGGAAAACGQESIVVIAVTTIFEQVSASHKYYHDFDKANARDTYHSGAFFGWVPVGHDFYFCLVAVYLNTEYYWDSNNIKDHPLQWDPGGFTVTSAWGQAEFQGGRDVRNPSYVSSWAGTWALGAEHGPSDIRFGNYKYPVRPNDDGIQDGSGTAPAALPPPTSALIPDPLLACSCIHYQIHVIVVFE